MSIFPARSSTNRHPDDGITILDNGVVHDQLSVVRAILHGHHVGFPNRRSSTTYVVTDGHARISVDGETFDAEAGDIVVAPNGVRRELHGQASIVIVCTPPFDPADET